MSSGVIIHPHSHLVFSGGRKLKGVIYLHRISDPRMGGNAKKILRMFRELCGESALKNVCIATTNWRRVVTHEGATRERKLREDPNLFKPLIDAGAQLVRWYDTEPSSAQSIVDNLIRKNRIKLQIQVELDEGKTLEETGAGSVLKEEITALAEKHKFDMQALQKDIEEATKTKQAELLVELEEERRKAEQQMLKIHEDLNKLKKQQTGIETGHSIFCGEAGINISVFFVLMLPLLFFAWSWMHPTPDPPPLSATPLSSV